MNKKVSVLMSLILMMIIVFVGLPKAVSVLGFSKGFFIGEVWRIFTYSFVHVSNLHLMENIVALIVLFLIWIEVGAKRFLESLFLGLLLIPLIFGLIYPDLVIVGASLTS